MFTVKDIAAEIGLNINTLRYWLNKNRKDCIANNYEFDLSKLFQAVKIYKKTKIKKNLFRKYQLNVVLDIDEFKDEFYKYFNYVNSLKTKKRESKLSWTPAAIDCYKCKMECKYCFNKDICENLINENNLEPPMKLLVQKLLTDLGKPTNN